MSSPVERQALGKAIKIRRTELDLSRGDLAEASRLSYPYMSEIENGGKWPSDKAIDSIAQALSLESGAALILMAEGYEAIGTDPAERRPAFRFEANAGGSDRPAQRSGIPEPHAMPQRSESLGPGSELERRINEIVEERVRSELKRWQEDVLPLLVRLELERPTDPGSDTR